VTLAHILNIDAISIDALLLATLQDRVKYRQLVKRRGQEAQSLLNLLQAVCLLTTKFLHNLHVLTLYSVWDFH
jgi:hypothetical protein